MLSLTYVSHFLQEFAEDIGSFFNRSHHASKRNMEYFYSNWIFLLEKRITKKRTHSCCLGSSIFMHFSQSSLTTFSSLVLVSSHVCLSLLSPTTLPTTLRMHLTSMPCSLSFFTMSPKSFKAKSLNENFSLDSDAADTTCTKKKIRRIIKLLDF